MSQQPPCRTCPPLLLPQEPLFFTHTLCPYAERVWIALLEKGVPFHLVHVDLAHKPAWFRTVNPRGLVPAVQHAGQVHLESADICRWIGGAFEGPALAPADEVARRDMERLIQGPCSGIVSAGLDLMAGKTGRYWGIGSGQSSGQRSAFEAELRQLAASLQQHGGPFLLGQQPSLADINLYPFLKRFDVGMRKLCGYDVSAALGGSIGEWLLAMDARPSCTATASDPALLAKAYEKHMCLDFFDYHTYTCFQLHPQNAHLLER